ncbi:MAG: response regulator [Pirellulales bacterium]
MSLQLAVEALIVDDSAVDRKLAASLLEKHSHLTVGAVGDGRQALTLIAQRPPDIVITDLRMPDMDGLELVKLLRERYIHLPVILMTAHGSEDTALEALRCGAASYVPKQCLARDLVPTVERVMELARPESHREQLLDCCAQSDSIYVLDSDEVLVNLMVDDTRRKLSRMKLCDTVQTLQIVSALEAALLNALYHGNLELGDQWRTAEGLQLAHARRHQPPYCDRRIRVRVKLAPDEVRCIVRDQGPGFVPDDGLRTTAASMVGEGGRGLVLVRSFMDEVTFNDTGNMVTLVRRLRPSKGSPRATAKSA